MKTISEQEFKKKYGTEGAALVSKPQEANFAQRLKEAATQGIGKIKSSHKDINSGNPLKFIEGSLRLGAGAVETAFSPITAAIQPVTKPTLGRAINYTTDKISNSEAVQKFATSKPGQITSRIVEGVNNLNTIASVVPGPKIGSSLSKSASHIAEGVPTVSLGKSLGKINTGPLAGVAKNVAKDISPTYGSIINEQITRAFELTPGDLKNISRSTGNSVGDFVAKHDLIGNTVDSSRRLLDDFYKENYATVRTEINKVPTPYKVMAVPRYTEALNELQKQITDVPGLQKSSAEINALLKKKTVTLADVQRVKELMDDHFNLYKVTGDVSQGVAKEGLANIRKDLRGFIEKEVKKNSGVDIGELNNNVSTSRSILEAVKDRAGRPTTRAQISISDLGWFGGGSLVGTPLFGIAAVFAKKVLESPSVRLRIAKFMKSLSDAKKLKIKAELQSGEIPDELAPFVPTPE